VRRAVTIMGALTALQWPLSFYQGGLLGLQRQVLHNGITIATSTLSGGGALLVLWLVSPTVSAFFTWQIAVSLLQTAATTFALWRCLPDSGRAARFDPTITRNIWGFAAGMSGITLTALILTQLDKVILSKLLDLKTFGYYVLAGVVVNGISAVLITPMFNTVYPRFSALVAAKDEKGLTEMYHGSTQVMAVMILPVAAVLAFFSHEIMMLWTQNAEVARNTAPIVSILVAGTALNGIMNLPYALQLAHGWTRLAFTITTVYIFTLGPAIVFLTIHYGAIGAASAWAALNVVHVAVMIPFTHRRLLTGESWRWYIEDFGLPLLGALLVCTVGRILLTGPMEPPQMAIGLIILLLATIVGSALTVPAGRHFLIFWRNTANTGKLS
jgi:O-antigen/teichoic acid export membrane protein